MPREYFTAHLTDSRELGVGYRLLTLGGCAALAASRPGQFVMLRGPWGRDPVLPRAYSILSADGERARFLVQRVGRGSNLLADAAVGEPITVLGPLGNGFPEPEASDTVSLLVAGGCGLPPLHLAATRAAEVRRGAQIELLQGTRSSGQLLSPLLDELRARELRLWIATEDGSAGERGLVTQLLQRRLEHLHPGPCRVLACGPTAMLRAVREVARQHGVQCLLSLEAEMACGLGACLGCAVEAPGSGYVHVCSDGPVFDGEEVWP